MKEELTKLADFLADYSNTTFAGDIVASLLDDLAIGVTAEDIIDDLKGNGFLEDE
jgi:hypothetical protein